MYDLIYNSLPFHTSLNFLTVDQSCSPQVLISRNARTVEEMMEVAANWHPGQSGNK